MMATRRLGPAVPVLVTAGVVLAAPACAAGEAVTLSGGLTAVALDASGGRIAGDTTLSVDLNIERRSAAGRLFVYVEGNSELDANGVSRRLVESNADAGTAVAADFGGRVQISELNYRLDRPAGRITVGLVDPSSYLDRSRITNDENVQFLGVSFVNNPTIEFPDYTLGVIYERLRPGSTRQVNLLLTSSNGIADNPDFSYDELVDVTGEGKGLFGALGLGWVGDASLYRLGLWLNTRERAPRLRDAAARANRGIYAVIGRSFGRHSLNLRLGLADEHAARASGFAALAYRLRWRRHTAGIGVARTCLSGREADPLLGDAAHWEAYARLALSGSSHLTLSVQRLRNSGFHRASADPRHSATVAGLRFHYRF